MISLEEKPLPLFEFKCKSCGRKFTALVGTIADSKPLGCPSCGSADLAKLVSRFSTARSGEDLLEDICDPDKVGDLDNPDNVRKLAKQMGDEMGEDLGEEFEEYLEDAQRDSQGAEEDDGIY